MSTENYNKVIESLSIRFIKCSSTSVLAPFEIRNFEENENVIVFLKKGAMSINGDQVKEGEAVMIPASRTSELTFGKADDDITRMDMEEFRFKRNEFFAEFEMGNNNSIGEVTTISFEAKIFDTVGFFNTLEIPSFILNSPSISSLIYDITKELQDDSAGTQRVVSLKTEHIAIEVIRYILDKNLFMEKMVTNSTYFKDPRLISLFQYIKDNLQGELTNKNLADIAGVSEDYVGQYFKALTGINPQDYIEYKRMEYAVDLLRTTKLSIRDVGKSCGYKDTAYFCRRFKMMYGIPAGKMRKRETLMNV